MGGFSIRFLLFLWFCSRSILGKILRSKTIGDFAVFPLCFNRVDFQSDFSCFCGSAPDLRLFSLPRESFVFRFFIVSGCLDLMMKVCMESQFWSIAQTIALWGHDEEGIGDSTRMHEAGICICIYFIFKISFNCLFVSTGDCNFQFVRLDHWCRCRMAFYY